MQYSAASFIIYRRNSICRVLVGQKVCPILDHFVDIFVKLVQLVFVGIIHVHAAGAKGPLAGLPGDVFCHVGTERSVGVVVALDDGGVALDAVGVHCCLIQFFIQ